VVKLAVDTTYVQRILPLMDGVYKLNDQSMNASVRSFIVQQYLWSGNILYMYVLGDYSPVQVDAYKN
jgi:hypothetical protein